MNVRFMMEQMQLMHKLCKNELEQTYQFVSSTRELVNDLLKIENLHGKFRSEQIIFFEESLNKYQMCHNFLRTINLQFMQLNQGFLNNNSSELYLKPISKRNLKRLHSKFNLINFTEGENLNVIITSIPKENQLQFYGAIKSNELMEMLERIDRLNAEKQLFLKYNYIPEENEVFGVDLNEILFRAVIDMQTLLDDFLNFSVLLIDFGNLMPVTSNTKLYHLPDDIIAYPAQAFKCELKLLENENEGRMVKFLRDHLHTCHTFKIVSIQNETVYLQTSLEFPSKENNTNSTNPFFNPEFEFVETNLTLKTDMSSIEGTPAPFINAMNKDSNGTKAGFDLTAEERENFFTEDFSTSNPFKAVFGFNPKDDSKICKFSKKGTCFKKSNCRLLHVDKIRDGWSRDENEILMNIKNEIAYPQVNTTLEVIVTHVETPEYIYVQLNDYFNLHLELFSKMNCDEQVKKLQKYSINSAPNLHELVLAQYGTDESWYRARILYVVEAHYYVFFVDYGNTEFVLIDRIRKWEKEFEKCPFMAVRCRLNGICSKVITSEEAVSFLQKELLNEKFMAKVINNMEDLCIDIKFGESTLSDSLIEQGLVLADLNPTYGSAAGKSLTISNV